MAFKRMNTAKKDRGNRLLAIGKVCLLSLVSLVLLIFVLFNALKFVIYPDYYAIKTDVCANPGLGDGFICQGVCRQEESGKLFVCGYMMDGSASRIYVTDTDNRSYYVSLTLGGEGFTGHAGGIATHGSQVYLVCSRAVHIIPVQSLLDAENGDTVEIPEVIPLDNSCSSAYCDGTYLYVGEFYRAKTYETEHSFDTPDGRYHAIIGRYPLEDLSAPDRIYAIRDKVQGICFTPDGKVVLSTSYGLTDSHYYVYDESRATDAGLKLDGAPVFYLWEAEKVVKGPMMAQGLDDFQGKVMTLTESASNKYLLGKFFFADQIVALDLLAP